MKRHDFSQIFTNFARTMGNIAKNVDEQIDLLQSRGMIQKTFKKLSLIFCHIKKKS